MPNIFKNDEQRQRWYEYNNKYSRENYRTFCIKLNKKTDKELIEYLESSNKTTTQVIKDLIKTKLGDNNDSDETVAPEIEKGPAYMSSKNQNNNIRKIRMQHGLTQTELADALGMTKQALSLNETGRISRRTAKKIADYFNISVLEVMGMDAFEYTPVNEEERQYLIGLLNQLKFENHEED